MKFPLINCLSQSDDSLLLSVSITPPFTAHLPSVSVCLNALYVCVYVCVNIEWVQPAKCVCVCLCLEQVCVFLLWGQWKLMTACCLIKQSDIHTHVDHTIHGTPTNTHTLTQYTLNKTQSHIPPQMQHTNHTPCLSWHQSRLADFINSTSEIKKVLLKSSNCVNNLLKGCIAERWVNTAWMKIHGLLT